MFETDFELSDDLSLNFAKPAEPPSRKRLSELPVEENVKKAKTVIKSGMPAVLPKNVVNRRFPGPAGLLPDRSALDLTIRHDLDSEPTNQDIPCSQQTLAYFQSGPWFEMISEYKQIVDRFNVTWIKTRSKHNQRAPFLAAIIQSLDCHDGKNPVVDVVLKDPTGQIRGTIIHSLYKKYAEQLVMGSVIVLKQCAVLTVGNPPSHHLNITSNNLVTIYMKSRESDVVTTKIQSISCEDFIGLLNFHNSVQQAKEDQNVSQVVVKTKMEDLEIWQNVLGDLDTEAFFEDF